MKRPPRFDKASLARTLVSNCHMAPEQARSCVEAIWTRMIQALQSGAVVQLRGIGTWSTRASRVPRRRNIRFRISPLVLTEADLHRPAADPEQLRAGTMVKIAHTVEDLIGVRPDRHILEQLLSQAGFNQAALLEVLTDMFHWHRVYSQDVRIFLADADAELARRKIGRYS